MKDSYEGLLEKEGFVLQYTRGISMEPMLREGREQSLIRSPRALGREPQLWDVVLFRRGEEYVLHRIVGRKGKLFRIRGDNCIGADLVRREQIIGILAGFYREEIYVDCMKDKSYLQYVRRRCRGFPFRWMKAWLRSMGKAVFKK